MKNTSDLKPEGLFPQRPNCFGRLLNNYASGRHAALRGSRQCTCSSRPLAGLRLSNHRDPACGGTDAPILVFQQPVKSCRGFTLLEIMVAVAIMAIVLVSIYKLHAQTISMNASARFYTTAPLLAQRTVAEIQAIPDRRWVAADGDFGDEFPGYSRRVLIDDVSAEIFGSAAKDLKKIEVTISFNHNEFVYTLRTYSILQEP